MPLQKNSGRIQVAVIEGAHPFDVPAWHQMFRSYDFMDYYPQPIENWIADWGKCRNDYDVALFYNMNMDPASSPLAQGVDEALAAFTRAGGGVCILHHALLAFPENPVFAGAIGLPDRSFDYHPEQELRVEIANPEHPICQGVNAFTLNDETYVVADARSEDGNDILLVTDHPKSMKTLGWTRTLNSGRVFCLQCGHDNLVWSCPEFREIIGRGIRWLAGKLD